MELIKQRVIDKLYSEYGDNFKYYVEHRKQGIKKPCFFVLEVKNYLEKGFNKRYWLISNINIVMLFDELKDGLYLENETLKLKMLIEEIKDLRASNITSSIIDGQISILATYKMWIEKEEAKTLMNNLNLKEVVKDGR